VPFAVVQMALFCFPGQFHTGKCSVPKGTLFLYIQGNQPQQNRKGAIKNAETMPRQLFHPVYPVPHDEAAGLKIGIRNQQNEQYF